MTAHEHQHRVTYHETDKMGFVYYSNYLVYFEIGRTELIRASGLAYRELEDMGYCLPVIEASCRYHKPALYDDLLVIRTRASEFKGIRLGFDYEILREGITLAEGKTLHAFMDAQGRPRKLDRLLKEKLDKAFNK
ncbi:MAG TPA: thioesterase family protein [Nitrospirota bacterium]|nr:thioesterase family protein [Nitrospirota bacterium]